MLTNHINDPCAKLCIPDVVKTINVKVFNLMSKVMKQEQHEPCKRKCKLDASVCIYKQRWNKDGFRRTCKE